MPVDFAALSKKLKAKKEEARKEAGRAVAAIPKKKAATKATIAKTANIMGALSKAVKAGKAADAPAPAAKKEKEPPKYESFPLVSVISDQELMDNCINLMKEDVAIQERQTEDKLRREEIKVELAAVMTHYDLKGVRYGRLVTYYDGEVAGRKTLNKGKLLENGVSVEQLEASYVLGKSSLSCKVVDLDKKKKEGEEEE